MKPSRKDPGIESLRGLAIVLIVVFHTGLSLSEKMPLIFKQFQEVLGFIRMPLFTVISGFVYALRPVARDNTLDFLRGKARRLIVPMICVGSLIFVFSLKPPFVESLEEILGIWKILVFPFHHFWFIQALFLIFIVVAVLERLRCLENPRRWLALTALAALPGLFVAPDTYSNVDMPFSLDGAAFLFPYFLLGLGLHRFAGLLKRRGVVAGAVVLAVAGLIMGLLELLGEIHVPRHKGSAFYLAVSSSFIYLLFKFRTTVPLLGALGNYAYSIYLFHPYFIAVAGLSLKAIGSPLEPAAGFVVLFMCGLLLPIAAHELFRRFALTRRLLLGLR